MNKLFKLTGFIPFILIILVLETSHRNGSRPAGCTGHRCHTRFLPQLPSPVLLVIDFLRKQYLKHGLPRFAMRLRTRSMYAVASDRMPTSWQQRIFEVWFVRRLCQHVHGSSV